MKKVVFLHLAVVAGSAFCWWPVIIQPGIDMPVWVCLCIFSLLLGLALSLSHQHWRSLAAVAVAGTLIGSSWGFMVLPFTDVIGHTYWVFAVGFLTLVAAVVALMMSLVTRRVVVASPSHRRLVWAAIGCCVAFGPAAMALTPHFVNARFVCNERAAGERVAGLKKALARSMQENSDPGVYCAQSVIRQMYKGPGLTDQDWQVVTHRFVVEDGYFLMVYCPDKGGFRVNAVPQRFGVDGRKGFE